MSDAIVAVSGGFDCLHGGHIDYLDEASAYGHVLVFLNSDAWLMRKKGYVFMKYAERAKILRAIRYVKEVIPASDDDDTVIKSILDYRPDYFAKGGDRTMGNTPEVAVCKKCGVELLFNVGGDKTQSSSALVANVPKG